MTLNAIKTTAGYVVEGTDAVGKDVELFFNSDETRNYDHLTEVEDTFHKNRAFKAGLAKLPDPERDLYVTIFGKDQEDTDDALHTTLVEAQESQDGISLDWSRDSVTAALRLIAVGQGNRLRLIAGRLVDMGPTTQSTPASNPGASFPPAPTTGEPYVGQGNSNASGELHIGG